MQMILLTRNRRDLEEIIKYIIDVSEMLEL